MIGLVDAFDFVFLTAKPDELRSLLDVVESDRAFVPERDGSDDRAARGLLQSFSLRGNDRSYRSLFVTCRGMGHMEAGIRAAQLVRDHQPRLIIFIGTAASLIPGEIQIGDVVVPRKSVIRLYEKISEQGTRDHAVRSSNPSFREHFLENNVLVSDTQTIDPSSTDQGIQALIRVDGVQLSSGQPQKITLGGEQIELRNPKVITDCDIFSCGMVVDSSSYREFIVNLVNEGNRKVGIIDMESFGFLRSLEALRSDGVGTAASGLMVRGISDYAGRKKDTESLPTDWRRLSVANASIVALNLVKRIVRHTPNAS